MKINILRKKHPLCTPGIMEIDGAYFGKTLERPWIRNRDLVSCIPAGTYEIAVTWSPRFDRPMLEVMHVKDREGIRVHGVNRWIQLAGCVGVSRFAPTAETLWLDLSEKLKAMVTARINAGEIAEITFTDPI